MWDDIFGNLLGWLIDSPAADRDSNFRRERVSRKRRAAFKSGGEITLRCALRWPSGGFQRWHTGKLRRSCWERFRLSRMDVVLVYTLRGSRLELAIRHRDLADLARLFEIPPNHP